MIDEHTAADLRMDDDGAPVPAQPLVGSFKVQCWDHADKDDSPGASNGVRVATIPEAEAYGRDLYSRWMGLRRWEVQSSAEPVTCVWNFETNHLDWIRR
jgi:hypothetical protein